jgi:hypothetical protein
MACFSFLAPKESILYCGGGSVFTPLESRALFALKENQEQTCSTLKKLTQSPLAWA